MKFILLLIPMILLSSCTIDGNYKKMATQSIPENIIQTGTIIVEKPKWEASTWAAIQDFWSGFTLSQTDDETILSYSGKVVKTWSHTPPEKVPFVWDEACVDFFEAMNMITLVDRGKDINWIQTVWEKFDETTKKNCMKEYFWSSIQVEVLQSRFFKIIQTKYDTAILWIYDTKSENLQQMPTIWTLKITESEPWTTVFIDMIYWDDNMKLLYNKDFSRLLSKEEIPKP
jgi:hypothetical protein